MDNQNYSGHIGFIITKAPLENSSIKKLLKAALEAINKNNKIGFFLISDGVFLIKKNQKNETYDIFKNIITKKVEIIVSKDHLESAGLSSDEIFSNLTISNKPYDDLVDFVMEKYERVITI
jgi:sulfur relay (sulfurtransferase) DsrF/TusC family protein